MDTDTSCGRLDASKLREKLGEPYHIVPSLIWDTDTMLSPTEKLIYLYLTRCEQYAAKKAFPAMETIAKQCGVHENTARKYIKSLIKKKWVIKEYRYENGQQKSNIYHLFVPDHIYHQWIERLEKARTERPEQQIPQGGNGKCRAGVQNVKPPEGNGKCRQETNKNIKTNNNKQDDVVVREISSEETEQVKKWWKANGRGGSLTEKMAGAITLEQDWQVVLAGIVSDVEIKRPLALLASVGVAAGFAEFRAGRLCRSANRKKPKGDQVSQDEYPVYCPGREPVMPGWEEAKAEAEAWAARRGGGADE